MRITPTRRDPEIPPTAHIISQGRLINHNETLLGVPRHGVSLNHNETLVPVVRAIAYNHNETLVRAGG